MHRTFSKNILVGYNQGRLVISDCYGETEAVFFSYEMSLALLALTAYDEESTQESFICAKLGCSSKEAKVLLCYTERKCQKFFENAVSDSFSRQVNINRLYKNEKIDSRNLRLDYPNALAVIPTWKCNNNCLYCGVPKIDPGKEELQISDDIWDKRIKEAVRNGVQQVNIHGGEPLIFAQESFFQLVKWMSIHNVHLYLSTKNRITDSLAEKVIGAGIQEIQLSLDTTNDRIASYLRYPPNYLKDFHESINVLNRYNIPVRINIVATSINIENIPETIRQLSNLPINHIGISEFKKSKYSPDYTPTVQQKEMLQTRLRALSTDIPVANGCNIGFPKASQKAVCEGGRSGLVILPDGSVTLCDFLAGMPDFKVGNIVNQTIEEIWNSKKLKSLVYVRKERLLHHKCFTCTGKEDCLSKGFCYTKAIQQRTMFPDMTCIECWR